MIADPLSQVLVKEGDSLESKMCMYVWVQLSSSMEGRYNSVNLIQTLTILIVHLSKKEDKLLSAC